MGISRDKWHKRRPTGGRRPQPRKKRRYELGRPAANTKIGSKRVHRVRARGGNIKLRALRLDTGNYGWASEGVSRQTRVIDVVYNASNNELVRTKTLVKSCIVQIDATPFRQWYESHYAKPLGKTKVTKAVAEAEMLKDKTKKVLKKFANRSKTAGVETALSDQFNSGRLLARLTSRPGQVGRADGVILEGRELEFYLRKLKTKKNR